MQASGFPQSDNGHCYSFHLASVPRPYVNILNVVPGSRTFARFVFGIWVDTQGGKDTAGFIAQILWSRIAVSS